MVRILILLDRACILCAHSRPPSWKQPAEMPGFTTDKQMETGSNSWIEEACSPAFSSPGTSGRTLGVSIFVSSLKAFVLAAADIVAKN